MTVSKRLFDIFVALGMGLLLLPVLGVLALLILILDRQSPFYASERMKTPEQAFRLWKLRSMRQDPSDDRTPLGVSGGDKAGRITPLGRILRRSRLDELPQLWNVLRGDLSLVGPRPPLRVYVERFPDLYGRVLRNRPGITGLATLTFHAHEDRLLARCTSAAETDAVYMRRCVGRKARLDLIYQGRQSLCLDLWLIARSLKLIAGSAGRSAARTSERREPGRRC